MVEYKAGLYVRVSNYKKHRLSDGYQEIIRNQILIGNDFADKSEYLEIINVYADDGYTGVHFNRPEFNKMLADIQKGIINMVIVKDLSRLGRNYIEIGKLIRFTFPSFNIRFISINDNYDSMHDSSDDLLLSMAVKSVVDENYAKYISDAIRSEQKMKRQEGMFIGSHVVYGYKKMVENKYRLAIDEEAATVVRNIFQWKADRMSCAEIAELLNRQRVLSPREYKRKNESNYQTSFQRYEKAKWYPATIERIIKNRIYIGYIEQGKTKVVSYWSSEVMKVPENEWDIKEEMHWPIVTKEVFDKANKELIGGSKKPSTLFGGILFCGDCGQPMVRRVSKWNGKETVYYICSTNNKGKGCSRHSVKEEAIKEKIQVKKDFPAKINVLLNGEIEFP